MLPTSAGMGTSGRRIARKRQGRGPPDRSEERVCIVGQGELAALETDRTTDGASLPFGPPAVPSPSFLAGFPPVTRELASPVLEEAQSSFDPCSSDCREPTSEPSETQLSQCRGPTRPLRGHPSRDGSPGHHYGPFQKDVLYIYCPSTNDNLPRPSSLQALRITGDLHVCPDASRRETPGNPG